MLTVANPQPFSSSSAVGSSSFGVASPAPSRTVARSGLKAFPGAEGFGAKTKGGRGGRVIQVTNLNDWGKGSLRACATASGPRICVFRTGGTIVLSSDIVITHPYLTIAGQTAPGGGIAVRSASSDSTVQMRIRAPEVIIRYIRLRPGTNMMDSRALSMNNGATTRVAAVRNVMIDHNSFSWSGDELTIAWLATNHISYQWNIAAESLPPIDDAHGDTGIKGPSFGETGGGYFSVHHNLIAHHTQRLPQVSASAGPVDIVNNVVYNPGGQGSTAKNGTHVNYVKNYLRSGPNSRLSYYIHDDIGGPKGPAAAIYTEGNLLDGIPNLINSTEHVVSTRLSAPPVTETTAKTAYEDVLQKAGASQGLRCDGAWVPRRDAVDSRIVRSVIDRTRGHDLDPSQTFEQLGYISRPSDVGGWPVLAAGRPCRDADRDGMADKWETANFGNTRRGGKSDSSGDYDGDGYTDLEEFLNGTNPKRKT